MRTPTDPRIDTYIEAQAPFAQKILRHVRGLVHKAIPDIEETIKWSFPHFVKNGSIVCNMAAFKEHAALGFWHQGMQKVIGLSAAEAEGAGSFGRIKSLGDLPDDKTLVRYLQAADQLNASDQPARAARKAKPELPVPADLAGALKANAAATKTFNTFSPSMRREYVEWIVEAKREETRQKRIAQAVEWIAEGKSRNWKYENC